MQKIMFNDRYGLTQAVIEGRKYEECRARGVFDDGWDIIDYCVNYEDVSYVDEPDDKND